MATEYRYPVFLTEDDYELLVTMVKASGRGSKAARERIQRELNDAAGERTMCDENGNVPNAYG